MEILLQTRTAPMLCGEHRTFCMVPFPPCPNCSSACCFWPSWFSFAMDLIHSPLNWTERPGLISVSFGPFLSQQQAETRVPIKMLIQTPLILKLCSSVVLGLDLRLFYFRSLYFLIKSYVNAIEKYLINFSIYSQNSNIKFEESLRINEILR